MRALQLSLSLTCTLGFAVACNAPDSGTHDTAAVWAAADLTGSTPIVTAADGAAVYSVLADEGLVTRLDTATGAVSVLETGGAPSRITRWGDRLLVTLRGERTLLVLGDEAGALVELERVSTGAEPVGVVGSPDGRSVWVALYGQDEVQQFDEDLDIVGALAVSGRPSWLAMHPSGRTLYVVSGVGGTVQWFDVGSDSAIGTIVDIPPVVGAGRERVLDFTRRLTGDPAVRPDGAELAMPGLWVDNTSPPRHSAEEQRETDPAEDYARIGLGLSPNNPGVVLVGLDPVSGQPVEGAVRMRYAAAEGTPYSPDTVQVVRSFLSSVTYAPDGAQLAATREGSRLVEVLDMRAATETSAETAGLGGFRDGPLSVVLTDDGPRGVAWGEGGAWVLNAFTRSVSALPLPAIQDGFEAEDSAGVVADTLLHADPGVVLSAPTLDPTLEQGRLLFSSAVLPQMATPNAGVSCSTCHFESRNDGLSWPDFDTIPRQTKSLAGPMSLTAPFTWTEEVATVAEEARITSEARLGGRNATDAELDALAAWIEHTPDVDHADRGLSTPAIERGWALFTRSDVGCARCHAGDRYSDQQPHDLYGLAGVDTPSLTGIAATAPYLHDGSAATLRDVLDTTRDGAMGDTSGLTDADLDDLEAFLRSL